MTDSCKRNLCENDEVLEDEKSAKAKRCEIDIPLADVDTKLAEKLDSILQIGDSRKPKFLTNKPKAKPTSQLGLENDPSIQGKLIRRNLSKKAIKDRVRTRYDTLVPELDPDRTKVRLIKVLSANESIELGQSQAKKQIERQLNLNSVSGNLTAHKVGLKAFRFNDGYEMPMDNPDSMVLHRRQPSILKSKLKSTGSSKTVSFSQDPNDDYYDSDDVTLSESSSDD